MKTNRSAFAVMAFVALAAQVEGKTAMAEALRYVGVENASPADVARITELWTRAQKPGLVGDERKLAFRDLYVLYARLHGRDLSDRPQVLDGLAQWVAGIFEAGGRMDLALPTPRGTPSGTYIHVETRGDGPIPLLLISDFGVDGGKLYDSFARRQEHAYTMHIVTLPWAGAARPLPWPERINYSERPWIREIEHELLTLIDEARMKGITVVGTSAGGYFAARLALLRPKQVRSVVLVHALVNSPLRSTADPDAPASATERQNRVRSAPPAPMFFPLIPMPDDKELRRLIADPASMHPSVRNWMAFAVKDPKISEAWTYEALSGGFFLPGAEYGLELLSTDLTPELKDLEVPMLAMGSFHDEGSPVQSPPSLSQWEEMKLRDPAIPLTVVAFEDARAYLSVECPAEFDRALADFLAGHKVEGKSGYSRSRTSPRAAVMQSMGGAEMRIAYGSPAVKGRKLWGELMPLGRVWRAGANEATTFFFNHDVEVEGHALPAGTYTFFVIPAESSWTVIFNRVPRQWGASSYDRAFDALRFEAKPADGEQAEYLSYRLEPDGSNGIIVTLAWEKKRLSFRVAPAANAHRTEGQ